MLTNEIIKLFQSNNISLTQFDHFDYAEAVQQLKKDYHSSINNHPKKKQIVQSFVQKCYKKMSHENPTIRRKKCKDFLKRMEVHKKIHDQKLEALQFINQVYDEKNQQLFFYPKITKKYQSAQKAYSSVSSFHDQNAMLTASRNYYNQSHNIIKEVQQQDNQDLVSDQGRIIAPNDSQKYLICQDLSNISSHNCLSHFNNIFDSKS